MDESKPARRHYSVGPLAQMDVSGRPYRQRRRLLAQEGLHDGGGQRPQLGGQVGPVGIGLALPQAQAGHAQAGLRPQERPHPHGGLAKTLKPPDDETD